MGKVVAIGGGAVNTLGAINREIIALSAKRRPRMLFVPTASKDTVDYWRTVDRTFTRLGCRTDVLWCIREKPARRTVREKVGRADIVYVGGGNTLMMMRRWKFLGVDAALRTAHRRGAVLAGASAGAICWFDNGHSDSMRGYGHDPFDYIRVSGLGFVAGTLCPHYHHTDRRADFIRMIRRLGGFGVAVDDGAAIEVVDGQFRILAARRGARAWTLWRAGGKVVERPVPRRKAFQPLTELYGK